MPVWLYAPLPPMTRPNTVWTVRVFEDDDGRRRSELGGARISPGLATAAPVEPEMGMIAVLGRTRMRLDDYMNSWNTPTPPGAHEDTRIISGIQPQDMPDRWEGLMSFNTIVWSDAIPQQMRTDASRALREWVRRGGHLIIVLPDAGNPWGLGARGQSWLEDLLPTTAPRRDEAVMVSELMPLLTKSLEPPLRDFEMNIRVFKEIGEEYDALDNRYEPLMALPDGRVVAAHRLVDFGRITLIGIDLASNRLASMRLPQGDAFWNRIISRRADTPVAEELLDMQDVEPRMLARGTPPTVRIGDARILENTINQPGRAETGLLGAFVLFAIYFGLAGPFGYFMLKQRGMAQHAWLAFAATAALFTAIAWGGVRVLRQQNTEYNHVTFLDHVARPWETSLTGEPLYQRAVSWGSLYLPSYGSAEVAISSDPLQRDLLLTWSAPPAIQEPFPNVDRYPIDIARSPAKYDIPVRATATQLYANWMGAINPEWGGTIRVDPADPITITEPVPGMPARITGTLISDLPGVLHDVTLIWVMNNRPRQRTYAIDPDDGSETSWVPVTRSGEMLNQGHMWKLVAAKRFATGDRINLSSELITSGRTGLLRNLYEMYIEPEEGDSFLNIGREQAVTQARAKNFMEMLTLYHHLTPPKYLRSGDKEPQTVVVSRILGRELDLSGWLSRPCLIVLGYLHNSETPIPLEVDGRAPRSTGLTMVRWVYPLPLDESEIPMRAAR